MRAWASIAGIVLFLGAACSGEDKSECGQNGDCDDGVFCNGVEICQDGQCQGGETQCLTSICDEEGNRCVDCLQDTECDDGLWCNGSESCADGSCQAGTGPCAEEVCDESQDLCVECISDQDCTDDGLYCNGQETCNAQQTCQSEGSPCQPGDICDEDSDSCLYIQWRSITSGEGHTCAIDQDSVAYCWGRNKFGQLGDGRLVHSSAGPLEVDTTGISGAKTFIQLSAGRHHTCGITSDNVAYCWGAGGMGQLGDGSESTAAPVPVAVDTAGITGAKTFDYVSAGRLHTCGITGDGNAYCWGEGMRGKLGHGSEVEKELSPVAVDTAGMTGAQTFAQVSAGSGHTCGISTDAIAHCWGNNLSSELGVEGLNWAYSPVAVETADMEGSTTFTQISAGSGYSCGVAGDGVAHCWGAGRSGQLGVGYADDMFKLLRPYPVDTSGVTGSTTFSRVATGQIHTCGITVDGSTYCWGADADGRIGDGGVNQEVTSPVAVDNEGFIGSEVMIDVSVGGMHSCVVADDGRAYCWGSDQMDQLGDGGDPNYAPVPRVVDTSTITGDKVFTQVSAGYYNACGLMADGAVYCWGYDRYGRLGNGEPIQNEQSPVRVDTSGISGSTVFSKIAAGWFHTCGITDEGSAYCWGFDGYLQLGDGDGSVDSCDGLQECALTPVAVDTSTIVGDTTFVDIAGGWTHSCGIAGDGTAYCWGDGGFGQLGNGGVAASSPDLVDASVIAGAKTFSSIDAGPLHSCGVTDDGVAYCWGCGYAGQLGDGSTWVEAMTPVPVTAPWNPGEKSFVQLTTGGSSIDSGNSCGLTDDGMIYCWGSDGDGQLGDGGGSATSAVPVSLDTSGIAGSTTFVGISMKVRHVCAAADDGLAYCWGLNDFDQLGTGGFEEEALSPVLVDTSQVPGNPAIVQVSVGFTHSCGLTADGRALCWGHGRFGSVGDGGPTGEVQSPVAVGSP